MAPADRTDHLAYVRAVAATLKARGIRCGTCRDTSARRPAKRAAAMFLHAVRPWEHWKWADEITLEWDEELGWTVLVAHAYGPPHGWTEVRWGLGLDLVAEPADVVTRLDEDFDHRPPELSPWRRRSATDLDEELELALAAYGSS